MANNKLSLEDKIKKIIDIYEIIKFPFYNGSYPDEDFFRDNLKYLLSAKLDSKYRIYPEFINLEADINILESKKIKFRNSLNNYYLYNENKLCFIHTKTEKNNL